MSISLKKRTVNREISWLSFNRRVLQEAQDPNTPLLERLRFLGIFSNNLDEFFRVRVATLKRIQTISKKKELLGDKSPQETLDEIHEEVVRQKETFADTYQEILDALENEGIRMIDERELTDAQKDFADTYYRKYVAPLLIPIMLKKVPEFPYLRDKSIYLAVKMTSKKKGFKKQYALIEVPAERSDRFVVFPESDDNKYIMFLDDLIRFNLDKIFGLFEYSKLDAYTIKITRDAELDLDNDVSKGFYEKMKKSLKQRSTGQPVRFLYDEKMPKDLLKFFVKKLKIDDKDNIIAGGRYHNSKDFMKFPDLNPRLEWDSLRQSDHPRFLQSRSILAAIEKDDILLNYPYQHFRSFIHYLREAAIHPDVREIRISLYRVAKKSRVINALISAAKNGKQVTVMIELRARFDEGNNLENSKKLQEAGVKVIFGIHDMKVHCKLAIVTKVKGGKPSHNAVIATGNFHEGTARVYSDIALFTSHKGICEEVIKVFQFIEKPYLNFRFKHLIVAPAAMRSQYIRKLNREIKNAKDGKEASAFLKMNSLVDEALIRKLYQASRAGVKIRLIVRGICALIPGIKGVSENIEVRSIIDRFLEHARVFIFANGGDEEIFISSADWMERNLDHRVEVSCAIYEDGIRNQIRDFMELQWKDNTKARINDGSGENRYVAKKPGSRNYRAQVDFYEVIHSYDQKMD